MRTCDYVYPTRNWSRRKEAGDRCDVVLKTKGAIRCRLHAPCGKVKGDNHIVLSPRQHYIRHYGS